MMFPGSSVADLQSSRPSSQVLVMCLTAHRNSGSSKGSQMMFVAQSCPLRTASNSISLLIALDLNTCVGLPFCASSQISTVPHLPLVLVC